MDAISSCVWQGCPLVYFSLRVLITVFAIYQNHVGLENMQNNNVVKSTNPPTLGQPNPGTFRLNVAFGPLFPTANNLSWVGIDFI